MSDARFARWELDDTYELDNWSVRCTHISKIHGVTLSLIVDGVETAEFKVPFARVVFFQEILYSCDSAEELTAKLIAEKFIEVAEA